MVCFASLYLFVLLFESTDSFKMVEFAAKVAGSVVCLAMLLPDSAGGILTMATFSTEGTRNRLVDDHFFIIELLVFTVLTDEPFHSFRF